MASAGFSSRIGDFYFRPGARVLALGVSGESASRTGLYSLALTEPPRF